jgi:hypothetical protein
MYQDNHAHALLVMQLCLIAAQRWPLLRSLMSVLAQEWPFQQPLLYLHWLPMCCIIRLDGCPVPWVQGLDSDDEPTRHLLPIAQQGPLRAVLVLELQGREGECGEATSILCFLQTGMCNHPLCCNTADSGVHPR